MTLSIEQVAPYTIIDQALDRLRASARSKGVTIEECLPLNLPLIDTTTIRSCACLQNLIDNAIKFSSSNDTVSVGAHAYGARHPLQADVPLHPPFDDGSWLIFWVQDRGMGIPAAYHERIREILARCAGARCAAPAWA